MLQLLLVYVVLVLSHTKVLRVYLYKLCQRVHKPSAYADGTTRGDVLVREFLSCRWRSRIDARSVLRDDEYCRNLCVLVLPLVFFHGIADEVLSLAACRAIANGYRLNLIVVEHAHYGYRGLGIVTLRRVWINYLMMQQIALRIKTSGLAAVGESRVYSHGALLS